MKLRKIDPETEFVPTSVVITIESVEELRQLRRACRHLPQSSIAFCPDRSLWLKIISGLTELFESEIQKHVLQTKHED